VIAISEHSANGTIVLENGALNYDYMRVCWIMPGNGPQNLIERIELAGLAGEWPEHWHSEAPELWLKLALAECRQYYDYCAKERGLRAQGDLAVNTMLSNILRDFSVAQCYRIIWSGAKNTADFMVRERPNHAHAANYMIGACQRWADHARTDGWTVVPFKRNFKLPRCMISYVLFDVILRIGECGFNEVAAQRGGKLY
jgi:hypothetical protein